METSIFEGQQEGERILYTIHEHPLATYVAYLINSFMGMGLIIAAIIVSPFFGDASGIISLFGILFGFVVILVGMAWTKVHHDHTIAYITDRRIMRFEAVNPFFTSKRALFWNEALKAKAYAPNLFWKMLKIGELHIETQVPDQGDVRISHVYYFEDLENYVDKILYVFKNSPHEIATIKPFVPKPKGKRDIVFSQLT